MIRICTAALIAGVGAASAEEKREMDAHVHGAGSLDIAIDGATVVLALEAPGADIVGFEYEAESEENRAKVTAAVETLQSPLGLFVPSAAANCALVDVAVNLVGHEDDDHDEHEHHDDHDDHEEEHADHDDHGDEHE